MLAAMSPHGKSGNYLIISHTLIDTFNEVYYINFITNKEFLIPHYYLAGNKFYLGRGDISTEKCNSQPAGHYQQR
jgi:hypothetical protein